MNDGVAVGADRSKVFDRIDFVAALDRGKRDEMKDMNDAKISKMKLFGDVQAAG